MYKVLLVDDERIILEGISCIVDWQASGTKLIGTAKNGMEAYRMIEEHMPDIVISDIRMPGMDGLELVAKVKQGYPSIDFILLSGFSEFEYARQAMRFGVHHYLVKPCNEKAIAQSLCELVGERKLRLRRETFLASMEIELKKVLPHVKEQFFKELVTNKTYGGREWNEYCRLFRIPTVLHKVRLLLFELEGVFEFEHMFAIKNIATDIFDEETLLLSTTIGKQVLLLLKEFHEEETLFGMIERVKSTFNQYYHIDVTMALSEPGEITKARQMYRETLECLQHRFYLGEGGLITAKDISDAPKQETDELEPDEERLGLMIKSGRWSETEVELQQWFKAIAEARLGIAEVKSYLIPLYAFVVRHGLPERMNDYMKELAALERLNTLLSMQEFIMSIARDITMQHYERNKKKHSGTIAKMLAIIDNNIGNPQLSLQWVAGEMLFMNADYLGKLFKKETGYKFSHYLTKERIQKAVQYISASEDVKVFELADMLGFGDNPQYFSQVFKKHTGLTPSEFRKSP